MFLLLTVPAFTICNADQQDAGLTLEELYAPGCVEAIELAGAGPDQAISTFEFFDSDENQVVTREELSAGFFDNKN